MKYNPLDRYDGLGDSIRDRFDDLCESTLDFLEENAVGRILSIAARIIIGVILFTPVVAFFATIIIEVSWTLLTLLFLLLGIAGALFSL
jgi:hypothetical protein